MNDEKRELIKEAAGIVHDKKLAFANLGMVGIPQDTDKAREQTIAYELARAEMIEAKTHLRNLQDGMVGMVA